MSFQTVYVIVITPSPGAAPLVIDNVASAADAAAFVIAYKQQVSGSMRAAVLPVNKAVAPTMGVAP